MTDLSFDAATHRYWDGATELPSVTTILKGLKLTPWYPKSDEANAAMALGTRVHNATQKHDEGGQINLMASDEVMPYLSAWSDFLQHYGGQVTDCELKVMSNTHRYAGTLDRIINHHDGSVTILDIKTGSGGPQSWHKLQLAAYQIAWEESGHNMAGRPIKRVVCYLKPDGWKMLQSVDDQDLQAWKASVCLFYWKRWNK